MTTGERIRRKANIIVFRAAYRARQEFEVHRTIGCQNLWVNEYTIRYWAQWVEPACRAARADRGGPLTVSRR